MGILSSLKKALLGTNDQPEQEDAESRGSKSLDDSADTSAESYIAALLAQREAKDRHFQRDAYSPIPYDERDSFAGLNYYPPNIQLQFILNLEPDDVSPILFQTSTGESRTYLRAGTISFDVDGQPAELAVYQAEDDEYFLPFRDATSGKDTYGAGRYLEPIALGNGEMLVDFNLAYNPYCAYSPDFSCPLPPIENWLKVPIRAGEKKFKEEDE